MDTRISPGGARSDVTLTPTSARVTPSPGAPFRDVVTRGAGALVRGAEAAVSSLPGAPIVAAAVRPAPATTTGTFGAGPRAVSPSGAGAGGATGAPLGGYPAGTIGPFAGIAAAEGPGAAPGGTLPAGSELGGMERVLAQSQEQNLYFLQLQEAMAAENRAYSALSNVLKAKHDTVKNAIGNIR